MNKPIVSIIIPTHERFKYAVPTIRALLTISDSLEVVVCDTSTKDLITPALINEVNISRVRLIRPGVPLNVVDNFNRSLEEASGEYLAFIGDDDCVSNQIIDVANWAKSNEVDAIKFSFSAQYYWPDFMHWSHGNMLSSSLHIGNFSGRISNLDAKRALQEALGNFGGGVMDMPRAYAGIVSSNLVCDIKKKYGKLFGGVSPDIYSAALISATAKKCVRIDFPVIVPGSSGASTAGLSANGKHVGRLRDNSHIGAFKNLIWDIRIPEYYGVTTVWSYSLLKAIEEVNIPIEKVNFPRLYIKCIFYNRKHMTETLISLRDYVRKTSILPTMIYILVATFHEILWIIKKTYSLFKVKLTKGKTILVKTGLHDTYEAKLFLDEYLVNNSCNIKFLSNKN